MNVPDWLYRLNPKALSGGLIELYHCKVQLALAQAVIALNTPALANDRVVVLHHLFVETNSGAGQPFLNVQIFDNDGNNNLVTIYDAIAKNGAALNTDWAEVGTWGNQYVLLPGHRVQANVNFSGGVAANTATLSCQGWQIPRGQIQLAGNFS